MIAHLRGKIEEKFGNNGIIIDVGGVGYEMLVPVPDFEATALNEDRKFFTYHAVKENSEELYGFSSLAAKKIFELLISVQGIGPKAAIAILSLAEAEEVRNAIANADAAFISKAAGVGKKSLTGYGAATKTQIEEMVRLHLGLEKKPKPDDAADALAVAITCSFLHQQGNNGDYKFSNSRKKRL